MDIFFGIVGVLLLIVFFKHILAAFFGALVFGFAGSLFGETGLTIGVIFGIIVGLSMVHEENKNRNVGKDIPDSRGPTPVPPPGPVKDQDPSKKPGDNIKNGQMQMLSLILPILVILILVIIVTNFGLRDTTNLHTKIDKWATGHIDKHKDQLPEVSKVTWRCSCTVSPKNGSPFREDFLVSAGATLGAATAQPRANRSCEEKYGLMRKDDWNPCKCQIKDCIK